jgi:hypothetical protein
VSQEGTLIKEVSFSGLTLYPNPASNQVTIQNNNYRPLGIISIYDMSGKMIYRKFIGNTLATIDVKNLPSGFYYIRSDQLQATLKFIKH